MENTFLKLIDKIKKNAYERNVYKSGGWINQVNKSMKENNTKGLFTEWCGGKVTNDCIERGLKSKDPKIRKRAALAKAFRNINKKEQGGSIDTDITNTEEYIDILKKNFKNGVKRSVTKAMMDYLVEKTSDLSDAYDDYYSAIDRIQTTAKYLYGGLVEFEDGGDMPTDIPQEQPQLQEQESQPNTIENQQNNQSANQQITFEQYMQFVQSYPDYFQQLVSLIANELNNQQNQQTNTSTNQDNQQIAEPTAENLTKPTPTEMHPNMMQNMMNSNMMQGTDMMNNMMQ